MPAKAGTLASSPIGAQTGKTPEASTPKPVVESNLVGTGTDAVKPAVKKADAASEPASGAAAAPVSSAADKALPNSSAAQASPYSAATSAPKRPEQARESSPKPDIPKYQPPKSAPTKTVVRGPGFFPMVLGGVVAALLGAGATYWAIPRLPEAWRPALAQVGGADAALDAARQAGSEAARAAFGAEADAFAKRAAEQGADAARQVLADASSAAPAATPGSDAAIAPIAQGLTDKIAALERGYTELSARADTAPAAPAVMPDQAALDALSARMNEQQARIDELAARPTVDPATAAQVQTLADQAKDLQQSTEAANRRALGATAAAALQAAIESGAPRDQALADLAAAGVSVPPVLSGDIPRLEQIRGEFAQAARLGLRASLKATASQEGAMGRLGNFFLVQSGARSVEPREGTDPDAVLSRANAAVEAGDISAALTEIAALPQSGQDAMSEWTTKAKLWSDANAALATLATSVR